MHEFSSGAAWMNGSILPIADAKIGVTDWGITHSDAVYDVVPVVEGAFFRLGLYLERFEASLEAGRFDIGLALWAICETENLFRPPPGWAFKTYTAFSRSTLTATGHL